MFTPYLSDLQYQNCFKCVRPHGEPTCKWSTMHLHQGSWWQVEWRREGEGEFLLWGKSGLLICVWKRKKKTALQFLTQLRCSSCLSPLRWFESRLGNVIKLVLGQYPPGQYPPRQYSPRTEPPPPPVPISPRTISPQTIFPQDKIPPTPPFQYPPRQYSPRTKSPPPPPFQYPTGQNPPGRYCPGIILIPIKLLVIQG